MPDKPREPEWKTGYEVEGSDKDCPQRHKSETAAPAQPVPLKCTCRHADPLASSGRPFPHDPWCPTQVPAPAPVLTQPSVELVCPHCHQALEGRCKYPVPAVRLCDECFVGLASGNCGKYPCKHEAEHPVLPVGTAKDYWPIWTKGILPITAARRSTEEVACEFAEAYWRTCSPAKEKA